ncbi:uncharacterized protein FFNC_15573 [Fusarium fujikuroi]|nr:uncharacterized protein FFNC_15573 [Fusarium fujikuroi]
MATSDNLPLTHGNGTHGISSVTQPNNHPIDARCPSAKGVNGGLPSSHGPLPYRHECLPAQRLPQLQDDNRLQAYPPPPNQQLNYHGDCRRLESLLPNGQPGYRHIPTGIDKCSRVRRTSEHFMIGKPRRRRSRVACIRCQQKKIRCERSPGGQCQNCARANKECIVQSSSPSSTFLNSARLSGAHGQSLAPPPTYVSYQSALLPPANGYELV